MPVLDLAMRNSNATSSWPEIASVSDTGTGMRGWEKLVGDLRGSPLLVNHQGSEGPRTSLFVLGGGPNPNDLIYINQWRRTEPEWTGWYSFDPLPSTPMVDGLEVAARPNGDVDLAVLANDGHYYRAFMNVDLGYLDWFDLGNPNTSSPPGKRLSIESFLNTSTPTPYLQIDFVAIDGNGWAYHKRYSENHDWEPSEAGWNYLGGAGFMTFRRAHVSHNTRNETDIVAVDATTGTVHFKRWNDVVGAWAPDNGNWFNLGGSSVTEPVAVARPAVPDVVDIFIVSQDGSLWHRPYVVPPYNLDQLKQRYDIDYDAFCGCGAVTDATAKLPRARLGTSSCPCSR
jgi:hypothetical protein